MIEINLLPEDIRKKKRQTASTGISQINLKNLPFLKIAAIAVSGLVAIQLIVFIVGLIYGTNYSIIEKNYKEILPRKQETEKLRLQVDNMSKKVVAIDELMVKRFSWAKKLSDLSDSMTPGTWLTELGYYEKFGEISKTVKINLLKKKPDVESAPPVEKVTLRYLTISGMASSMGEEGTALIGRFMKSLKSNSEFYSDFSDIELGTITREKVDEQEVMKFAITCLFKIK